MIFNKLEILSAANMGSSGSPCAGCKILRRKCTAECVLAPYFPPDQPQKFVCVHKMFGASNVAKILNALPLHHREDAVNSLAYEADARLKDPVYGCVGAITRLQRQITQLQHQLASAKADLAYLTGRRESNYGNVLPFHGSTSILSPGTGEASSEGTHDQHHLAEQRRKWEQSQQTLLNKVQLMPDDMLEVASLNGGGSYQPGNTSARLGATNAPFLSHRLMNSFDIENSAGASEGALGI